MTHYAKRMISRSGKEDKKTQSSLIYRAGEMGDGELLLLFPS